MLPEEREHLVLDNINLVHHILNKYFYMNKSDRDYEDCFQEGCIGLMSAAKRFDESKGVKFPTYAVTMIRGYITSYRREKVNIIKIPRDKYDMIVQIVRLTSKGLTLTEVEEVTGYEHSEIQRLISTFSVDSLDNDITEDSVKYIDLHEIISNNTNDYEELLSEEHVSECISNVTSKLKDTTHRDIWEEYVWSMFYGEELNQTYFAKKYGFSQSYISRILIKFKKMFVEELSK